MGQDLIGLAQLSNVLDGYLLYLSKRRDVSRALPSPDPLAFARAWRVMGYSPSG